MKKLMHLIAGAFIALVMPTQLLAQQDSTQIPAFSWSQVAADTSLTFDFVVRYCDSMFALPHWYSFETSIGRMGV